MKRGCNTHAWQLWKVGIDLFLFRIVLSFLVAVEYPQNLCLFDIVGAGYNCGMGQGVWYIDAFYYGGKYTLYSLSAIS
jgi:hypothetical protein